MSEVLAAMAKNPEIFIGGSGMFIIVVVQLVLSAKTADKDRTERKEKDKADRDMYMDMHGKTTSATEKVATSLDKVTVAVLEFAKEQSKLSTQVEILRNKGK